MTPSDDPSVASGPINPEEPPQMPPLETQPLPASSGPIPPALDVSQMATMPAAPAWPSPSAPLPQPVPVQPWLMPSGALPQPAVSQSWPQPPSAQPWPQPSGGLPPPPPDKGSSAPAVSGWILTFVIVGLLLAALGGALFVTTPAPSASVHADGLSTASGLTALIAGLILLVLPFVLRLLQRSSERRPQSTLATSAPLVVTSVPAIAAEAPPSSPERSDSQSS